MADFVFVSCQIGAEPALKKDLAKHHPELKFAFSRPGFVTFKADSGISLEQPLRSPFARSFGASVGSVKVGAEESEFESIQSLFSKLPAQPFQHLHVWNRDQSVPGDRGFEPFHLPETLEFAKTLKAQTPTMEKVAINRTAKNGDNIVDVIRVDPDHFFVGWHPAFNSASRWPGGIPPLRPNPEMISRAYLKVQEALRWSQLPCVEGDVCVELGSSPGGACLALVEKGMKVIGVDPAIMDERVMSNPNFTHFRARAADLKRKEFAETKWLFADANIAPDNTLVAIEDIVTNRQVNVQGMLITLKLLTWDMADQIDKYVEQIRGWGYRHIRLRQLAFNRRELCVFAAKSKARLKFSKRKRN